MKRVRGSNRLRVKDLETLPEGYHDDGGGLRLFVESGGTRHWVLRLTINGQRRSFGLGRAPRDRFARGAQASSSKRHDL